MALENCTLCRGTGWKLVPREDGAGGSVAVACDCGMEDRASRVMERARIPKRYEHCDFESYVTDLTDGKTWTAQHANSLKQAKLFTQGFVHEYPGSSEKGLLFMGPSGVGKTHLAVAALKELIHRGHADDLGASKPSDWVRDIVGIVLNARYNENRTTIITTNYLDNPVTEGEAARLPNGKLIAPTREDALEQRIGSRMRSRLYEMCRTLEVSAPDFRREKTHAGRA